MKKIAKHDMTKWNVSETLDLWEEDTDPEKFVLVEKYRAISAENKRDFIVGWAVADNFNLGAFGKLNELCNS